ncbi:MAG: hypothetical protein ACR2QE_09465 [Acidimicrobiales bacterium]
MESVPEQARKWPLGVHAVALLLVLLALLLLVGTDAVFSADEGAGAIQAQRVAEEGIWVGSHPLPGLDHSVLGYPVHLAEQTGDGWHELTRHPAYIHVLAGAFTIGGYPAMVLLSILATVGAAAVTGSLAGRLDQRLAVPALWVMGLASPLLFDGYLVIAHSLGAFFAACAAWFLIGRWTPLHLVAGAASCAGVVLMRSEGVLLGAALALALIWAGSRTRDRERLIAGGVAAAATVTTYLVDGWWTTTLKDTTIASAGPGGARFQGGLVRGRWEGFERTWLWIGRAGLSANDELILLAVVLATAGALALRRNARGSVVVALGLTSAALIALRLIADPTAVVPGLLFAFPLLLVGLVLTDGRHLALGSGRGRDLVVAAGLYALAVIATQHSVGGTTEWGGRYFALGLPLICPVIVAAVLDGAQRLERVDRRRWLASLVVLSLGLSMMGVLGLRRAHDRTAQLVSTVAAGIDQAGPDAVVVTDVNPLARWSWELLDDARWTLVVTEDLPAADAALAAGGIDRFVYVGFLADEQQAVLARNHEVVAELTPSFDERWRVVVFE